MKDGRAKKTVLLFTKAPISSEAKTRLARDAGSDGAWAINTWLVKRSLEVRSKRRPDLDHIVYAASAPDRLWFETNARGWKVRTQSSGDLGVRLEQAFRELFAEGYEAVVAIGSDIPDLDPGLIQSAMRAISADRVAVGPTFDGGYYLIGMAPEIPLPFSGIEWGAADVYERTVRILREHGREVHELARLRDIDTLEDWSAYLGERRNPARAAKAA